MTDDRIEAVGFTGSIPGGRAIYDAAGTRARPIPVFAEMGSVNPVVVTEAAVVTLVGFPTQPVESLPLPGGYFQLLRR